MAVSRRTFIGSVVAGSVVAGSALAAVSANTLVKTISAPKVVPHASDVVGKITVGYQGWFACAGDAAPINKWWHWTQNWSEPPSPSNMASMAPIGRSARLPASM